MFGCLLSYKLSKSLYSLIHCSLIAFVIAVLTNAVVAIWVVFVPFAAVGAVGIPTNAGESFAATPRAVTSASVTAFVAETCPCASVLNL